ncbi:MAG: hypothetical protein IM631_12330 [Cytophagales bacterium]|nr:hypothetical protein [Cytophagales bacterium]MCA6382302.1 hypothetical protein [Cytophagales bacterium]
MPESSFDFKFFNHFHFCVIKPLTPEVKTLAFDLVYDNCSSDVQLVDNSIYVTGANSLPLVEAIKSAGLKLKFV